MKLHLTLDALTACIGLVALLSTSSPAGAEPAVRVSTTFETWGQSSVVLDEWTTLISATTPLGSSSRFDFWTAHVSATSDDRLDLSGLMNTRLRVSYFPGDRWIVRVGVSAPTGKTELTPDELAVSRLLSDRVRAYRGYRLGEGTGLDLSAAWSGPAGPFRLGLGGGYSIKGSYSPSKGSSDYDPGDQLRVTGGLDLPGTAWSGGGSVSATTYLPDRLAGTAAFQLGPRYDIEAHFAYRARRWTAAFDAERILYGAGRLIGENGNLVEEQMNSNAPEAYLRTQIEFRPMRTLHLRAFAGGRFFEPSEKGDGKAHRIDVGSGFRMRIAGSVWMDLSGRWSSARVFQEDGTLMDLNGLQGSAGVETRL